MKKISRNYIRVSQILNIFQNYRSVNREKLKKAQDMGTLVHEGIKDFFENKFHPVPGKGEGYFKSFLKWNELFRPRKLLSEARFYDDQLMITGMIDLLCNIDGNIYLIDFKTGSLSHPAIWELQLNFYYQLLVANENEILPSTLLIVHLDSDGTLPRLTQFPLNPEMKHTCLHALECFRYFQNHLVSN